MFFKLYEDKHCITIKIYDSGFKGAEARGYIIYQTKKDRLRKISHINKFILDNEELKERIKIFIEPRLILGKSKDYLKQLVTTYNIINGH